MYSLGIVELYNNKLHGFDNDMKRKYLLSYKINPLEFMNDQYIKTLFQMYHFYNEKCNIERKKCKDYKNYHNIIKDPKYYQLHIVKPIMVNNVLSCIIKTPFISIFQRKWRKYLQTKNFYG